MTSVNVYDIDAREIEELADKNDTTAAEIVCMLMQYVGDTVEANDLKE